MLDGLGAGIEQQIAAGDADVDGSAANVHGDVQRAKVEQLDIVIGVFDDQLP